MRTRSRGGRKNGVLGNVAENRRRGIQSTQIAPQTPYIALEHIPRQCIALSDWGTTDGLESSKHQLARGEIRFGKLRPYFHKVGITPIDGVCSADIVVTPKDAEWFGFVLGHISSIEFVESTNADSTGTKMPRTNWDNMARYEIPIPTRRIAEAFAAQIRPLIGSMLLAIHEFKLLASRRDTLLLKLTPGELRIKDAVRFMDDVSEEAG